MARTHYGNIQPQLDLEEHDGDNNAKRVSLVSAPTIYIIGDIGLTPTLGSRATYSNVTVINTATQIVVADTSRRSLAIRNISTSTVVIGTDNGVTLATGIPLKTDDVYEETEYDGAVWGIADATGQPIRWIAIRD